MASRLTIILSRFSGCYYFTRSVRQSLYFSLKIGTKGKSKIRTPDKKNIHLRKNETDQEVFMATFIEQYHRSPFELGHSPVIIDLGSNIGLTIVDFKQQYPNATIIGVEMDSENFELCKLNTSGFDNCTLLRAAIWETNGFINYRGSDEQSYTVEKNSFGDTGTVRCLTMDHLFKENNIIKADYIKMDIEGAEKAVLLDSTEKDWLRQVRYLSIEVHSLAEMTDSVLTKKIEDELKNRHFIVFKSAKHPSSILAINELLLST